MKLKLLQPLYYNLPTGTLDVADCWLYEDENGNTLDAVERGEVLEYDPNINSIDLLANALNAIQEHASVPLSQIVDLCSLPTWGSWESDTTDIYSWDTTGDEHTMLIYNGNRWVVETKE